MALDATTFFVRLPVALTLTTLYYGVFSDRAGQALARRILPHVRFAERSPLSHRESAVKVVVAGVMQALFLVVLVLVTGVNPVAPPTAVGFRPHLLVYGLLLGLGEMAMSVSLSNIVIQSLRQLAPAGCPQTWDGWMVILEGGWMKDFTRTTRVLPLAPAFALFMGYVAVEETIFRGVLLPYFAPVGPGLALVFSVFVFATVQAFGMPSWRSALFPVTGAVLVGTVHGALYLAVPTLLPLIVAHSLFVVMMFCSPTRPARVDYC